MFFLCVLSDSQEIIRTMVIRMIKAMVGLPALDRNSNTLANISIDQSLLKIFGEKERDSTALTQAFRMNVILYVGNHPYNQPTF